MVGLPKLVPSDRPSCGAVNQPAEILARARFNCDSDLFRLDAHSVYHLFPSDGESFYPTADPLHLDSAWMCRSSLLHSQPESRVACHLKPAVPAAARAATSVVGWGAGHHPSASICLSSPSFFPLFHLHQSLYLPLPCLTLHPPLPIFTLLHWHVSQICPLCASLTMHCFLYLT